MRSRQKVAVLMLVVIWNISWFNIRKSSPLLWRMCWLLTCDGRCGLTGAEVVSGHTRVVTKHGPLHLGQLQRPRTALLGHQHSVCLKHLDVVLEPGYLRELIIILSLAYQKILRRLSFILKILYLNTSEVFLASVFRFSQKLKVSIVLSWQQIIWFDQIEEKNGSGWKKEDLELNFDTV